VIASDMYTHLTSDFLIPFYLQSVLVHSANCVKKVYNSEHSSVTNRLKASCDFWE
jgi:hypothetical protein